MKNESLKLRAQKILNFLLIALLVVSFANFVLAATPDPGHPWAEVGDGTFAVSNTLSAVRTFTFPDNNATVVTNNSFSAGDLIYGSAASTTAQLPIGTTGKILSVVGGLPSWIATSTLGVAMTDLRGTLGVSQGGTGLSSFTSGDIMYATGATTFSKVASSTGGTIFQTSFTTGAPSWVATSTLGIALSDTRGTLSVSQGGTGANTLSANGVILGNGTSAVTSVAPGTYGNILVSNGTTWVATSSPSLSTVVTRPIMATGAVAAGNTVTQTAFSGGLFTVSASTTINQLTYNITNIGATAGTILICFYNESGGLLTSVSTTTAASVALKTQTVSPGLSLTPGNYYVAYGCGSGTACTGNRLTSFTTNAAAWINGATVPAGKKVYEGTMTMTAGTCNATLPAITGGASAVPAMRLDN